MHPGKQVLETIAQGLGATTPGKWEWLIHDHSCASLGIMPDPGMGDPLVLSVSPCRSCADGADPKEWKWGRCTTPIESNAAHISNCHPDAMRDVIAYVAELEEIASILQSTPSTRPQAVEDMKDVSEVREVMAAEIRRRARNEAIEEAAKTAQRFLIENPHYPASDMAASVRALKSEKDQ